MEAIYGNIDEIREDINKSKPRNDFLNEIKSKLEQKLNQEQTHVSKNNNNNFIVHNTEENEECIYENIIKQNEDIYENFENIPKKGYNTKIQKESEKSINFKVYKNFENPQKKLHFNELREKLQINIQENKSTIQNKLPEDDYDTDEEYNISLAPKVYERKINKNIENLDINSHRNSHFNDLRQKLQTNIQENKSMIQKKLTPENSLDDDFDDFDEGYDEVTNSIQVFPDILINVTNTYTLEDILKNPLFKKLSWIQVMDKINININHISMADQNVQNAKYALLVEEYNFNNEINILYSQFMQKLFIILSTNEQNLLFAYVNEVKKCSDNLLNKLIRTWKNFMFSSEFSDVLYYHLENDLNVFVQYCTHRIYSEKLLGQLISDKTRSVFKELLEDIQLEAKCNNLHLHAYQLMPVKKIYSLPHFIENLLMSLPNSNAERGICSMCLQAAKKLVARCTKETQEAKDEIKARSIINKLEFPKCSLKINSNLTRKFIKSDEMCLIEITNTLFKRKVVKKTLVHVFLFNDLFVVTKKCGEKYIVFDFCFRINMELENNTTFLALTYGNIELNTVLYIRIKENKDLKLSEMVFTCTTITDALRWSEVLDPPDTSHSEEVVYGNFNNFIRKVIVQRNFSATNSDEITLSIGEIYSILRETDDGWSFGKRDGDGESGWFQTEYVTSINI